MVCKTKRRNYGRHPYHIRFCFLFYSKLTNGEGANTYPHYQLMYRLYVSFYEVLADNQHQKDRIVVYYY